MAIVFAASADIRDLSVWSGTTQVSISASSAARTGSYSYYMDDGDMCSMYKWVPSRSDYYVKFCGYINESNCFGIRLREGSTIHVGVYASPTTGKIAVHRNVTEIGATIAGLIAPGVWNCIEVYASVHDSTGVVTIKLNGVQVLALTSQDTRNGGTGVIDNLLVVANGGINNGVWFDDIVVRDDDWPGTGGLYLLTANGDGSDTGWTASAGNRWDCIDEVPPSATDYISTSSGVANTKNTVTLSNLGVAVDSIASVSVLVKAKLAEAGTGNVRAIMNSGGTYGNGDSVALGTSEMWATLHTLVDPDTSSAWDATGVNALSAGVETL